MRAILVDWLVQVHSKFRLLQETLYMCVAVMDRYLQVSPLWGLCAEEKTKGQFMRCQRTSSAREGGSSSMSHFQECWPLLLGQPAEKCPEEMLSHHNHSSKETNQQMVWKSIWSPRCLWRLVLQAHLHSFHSSVLFGVKLSYLKDEEFS